MMVNRKQAWARIGGIATALGVAVAVSACGASSSSSSSAANATPAASSGSGTALSISTAKGSDGTYLIGPDGRALYLWVADANGKSSCSGACAQAWPPLLVKGKPSTSGGANGSDIGTVTRSNGAKQVTYMGHPLYYYAGDSAKGQVNGQGSDQFGAKWWLVAPSGSAITASGSSASASSSGSGSSNPY
jgi:predicted lipoprotein with Yx(FWY)xxD motif